MPQPIAIHRPAPPHVRRRGICLVIAAPSGAGKSSLTEALLASEPDASLSVSVTTRAPRAGERDGVDYHFTDPAGFDAMVAEGALLEWARVFGRGYGTPRAPVMALLAAGRDVVFDIDWQGHRQLKDGLGADDVVGVFVLPPSVGVLEQRLRSRGTDSEEEIARRMAAARSEISHWAEFDHTVINERFEDALADLRAILRSGRRATRRQPGLPSFVDAMLER